MRLRVVTSHCRVVAKTTWYYYKWISLDTIIRRFNVFLSILNTRIDLIKDKKKRNTLLCVMIDKSRNLFIVIDQGTDVRIHVYFWKRGSDMIIVRLIQTRRQWATSHQFKSINTYAQSYDSIITLVWREKQSSPFLIIIYSPYCKTVSPLHPRTLYAKFGWNLPHGSREEDDNMKSLQTDRQTDGQTTDNKRSEKITWAFSSGELKATS